MNGLCKREKLNRAQHFTFMQAGYTYILFMRVKRTLKLRDSGNPPYGVFWRRFINS